MFKTSMAYRLRKINNSYFLMSTKKCKNRKWLYELNETGAMIWQLCDQVKNIEEMLDQLAEIYNKNFDEYESKMIYSYILMMEKEELLQRENE